jgi:hypothetical protein
MGCCDIHLGPQQRCSHVGIDLPNVFALKPGMKSAHLVDGRHVDDFAVQWALSRGDRVGGFSGEQAPRGPIIDVALAPRGAQSSALNTGPLLRQLWDHLPGLTSGGALTVATGSGPARACRRGSRGLGTGSHRLLRPRVVAPHADQLPHNLHHGPASWHPAQGPTPVPSPTTCSWRHTLGVSSKSHEARR